MVSDCSEGRRVGKIILEMVLTLSNGTANEDTKERCGFTEEEDSATSVPWQWYVHVLGSTDMAHGDQCKGPGERNKGLS